MKTTLFKALAAANEISVSELGAPVGLDATAVYLDEPQASTPGYVIELVDGSVHYAQDQEIEIDEDGFSEYVGTDGLRREVLFMVRGEPRPITEADVQGRGEVPKA